MKAYWKALIYLLIFLVLHFGYEATEWAGATPFCGINESIYQHLKMGFWSYLFASIIEYVIERKKISRQGSFWYPRMLSTVIVPWILFILWYLAPLAYGRIKNVAAEVIWALITTYIPGVICGIMEKDIEKIELTRSLKIFIIILVIISAIEYVWFTYKPPWIDMFIDPESIPDPL